MENSRLILLSYDEYEKPFVGPAYRRAQTIKKQKIARGYEVIISLVNDAGFAAIRLDWKKVQQNKPKSRNPGARQLMMRF